MRLERLWLTDFRNYASAEVEFAPGLTVVRGPNGQGKTNLIEAVAYLATLESFRGAPTEALVRAGAERAVVRAGALREGRELLLEAEIVPGGRSRAQINRQPLKRARDLLGALRVSVFSPDDLEMVKGGPSGRRGFLDATLSSLHQRNDELRAAVDRVLRQRNALLKQAGGRLTPDVAVTLDVWDQKLSDSGEALAAARAGLVDQLGPLLDSAYARLAGRPVPVGASYAPAWRTEGLAAALAAGRSDDVKRGITQVGPHRDELDLTLDGLPARTHASQGEQRSLALALRLAAHEVVGSSAGSPLLLLLDDVFSELDEERAHALVEHLPAGQTILTTAGRPPAGTEPERVYEVRDATVVPAD